MELVKLNVFERLDNCVESMLFNSGHEIANATFKVNDEKYFVELRVVGDVNVEYKGEYYKMPSEFPDELYHRIADDSEPWTYQKSNETEEEFNALGLYVHFNNWFEYFVYEVDDEDELDCMYSLVCDSDISYYTENELVNEMKEILGFALENNR